jgi:hypothetical protein
MRVPVILTDCRGPFPGARSLFPGPFPDPWNLLPRPWNLFRGPLISKSFARFLHLEVPIICIKVTSLSCEVPFPVPSLNFEVPFLKFMNFEVPLKVLNFLRCRPKSLNSKKVPILRSLNFEVPFEVPEFRGILSRSLSFEVPFEVSFLSP